MSEKIYEMVTERIIKLLEQGVIPWRRPWAVGAAGGAVNWKTQKPYRGVNVFLVEPGEYATYKQVKEAGGNIKAKEKGHIVIFWTWLEKKDKETGEETKIPYLRYYTVFEINKQCEGLKSKRSERKEIHFEHNPLEEAEKVINGFENGPAISFASGRAYYRPSTDAVTIPPLCDYPKAEEYYSTAFHELIHSTGHAKRLKRDGITEVAAFGSEVYSKEELVAEMGAAMLCGVTGIDNSTIENSASYINGWLGRLKDDKKLIIQASGQAQKAADHILGITFNE